ncbi:FAD-dependent oxidoreductase [Kitasatospora xanthocidica]|uniref:NAD(P)/FAD-dependent oxidoreductase n=1 Tax=Kitasatospora xanthocidica TaxID=83382 RepID=UPI001674298D|nr:FAD-binding oxidoreductase [Kitasatospora xanthocidica]GHF70264.1 FAD-dependent oxidoreductase [Kitasatospora xanthocidica]
MAAVNGEVSFWYAASGVPEPGPALPGDRDVDVCVVGGGYTGLWAAYYLKKADPSLRIALLEQRFCGYGASGRNGGWLYNGFAGRGAFAKRYGQGRAAAMQRMMDDAVGEVVDIAAAERIDADVVRGGVLEVARSKPQLERLRAFVEGERAYGEGRVELLGAGEAGDRIAVAGTLGGCWSPYGARVQPAKLVRGLARVVRELGVEVYEGTTVTAILPGSAYRKPRAVTPLGTVTADRVLRATEGFTAGLRGEKRTWLPMNSAMVATEPLPAGFWADAGWQGREVLGDFAHAYMYAQRTADDRIALGGRGVPYRFGSRTDSDGSTQVETVRQLRAILNRFFPAAAHARIDHAWAGVLGVPRDWCATVELDRVTGLGWAGGYVGSGVTTTNLAGRTLRDLVLGHDTELTRLPWVGHTVRRWEPEPLRWLGVQAMYAAYHAADRQEAAGRATTSPIARVADLVAGR